MNCAKPTTQYVFEMVMRNIPTPSSITSADMYRSIQLFVNQLEYDGYEIVKTKPGQDEQTKEKVGGGMEAYMNQEPELTEEQKKWWTANVFNRETEFTPAIEKQDNENQNLGFKWWEHDRKPPKAKDSPEQERIVMPKSEKEERMQRTRRALESDLAHECGNEAPPQVQGIDIQAELKAVTHTIQTGHDVILKKDAEALLKKVMGIK